MGENTTGKKPPGEEKNPDCCALSVSLSIYSHSLSYANSHLQDPKIGLHLDAENLSHSLVGAFAEMEELWK